MALAGWCGRCASYVWIRTDGSCAGGHEPAAVSHLYEAGPAPSGPAAAAEASAAESVATATSTAAVAAVAIAPAATSAPAETAPIADAAAAATIAPLPTSIRYDLDLDLVRMPASDLAAAVTLSGIRPGPLAPSIGAQPAPDTAGRLAALTGRAAEILDGAVAALADPPRSAVVQYAVADESVSRLALAWSANLERVAIVAHQGSDVAVSLRTPDAVFALLAGAVGLGGALEPVDARVSIASRDAMTWIATADTLRRARIQSLLAHTAPADTCTAADVGTTLAGAEAEDFRWALNMVDKVTAYRPAEIADARAVTAALDGLVAAGVLDVCPADDGAVALYGLGPIGIAALDAWTHEIGRLAVSVHGLGESGTISETALLVRDARRLWLVDVAPTGGAIACLGVHEAELLLRNLSGAALPPAE